MNMSNFKKIFLLIFIAMIVFILAQRGSQPVHKYNRQDYKHWIDADGDCQNTRQEVLISESLEKVKLDESGCKVVSGKWHDSYTDKDFTDPHELDIDHFIPLKEVDRSGGEFWSTEKKMLYANDLDDAETLIAVSKSANRAKGDKDPLHWMPQNQKYHCEYIRNWVRVKMKWHLVMDEEEKNFIEHQRKICEANLEKKTGNVSLMQSKAGGK